MSLRVTSSAIALMIFSGPAAYALTPEEAWSNWEQYIKTSGYEVTVGSRSGDADTLTLSDVVLDMSTDTDDESTQMTMTFPTITLTDAGNDNVETSLPAPATLDIVSKRTPYTYGEETEGEGEETAEPAEMEVVSEVQAELDLSRMKSVSSDHEGGQRDVSTADEVTLTMTKLTTDETTFEGKPVVVTLRDLTSDQLLRDGVYSSMDATIGEVELTADIADAEAETTTRVDAKVTGIKSTSEAKVPAGNNFSTPTDMVAALRAAAAVKGMFTFEGASLEARVEAKDYEGQPTKTEVDMTSGAGSFNVEMDETGLVYQSDIADIKHKMTGSALGKDVEVSIDSAMFDIAFPLLKSEESQPFKVAYSLSNLTLGDAIWDEMDEDKVFERTPFELDIDVTGNVVLQADLLDIDETSFEGEYVDPVLPVDVEVNNVSFSGLGVTAKASGAFSFPDREDLSILKGQLQARYTGINAFLGKLVESGQLTSDDVAGMRIMMMMGTKAVEGEEDTLETNAEFKEDGGIVINGQIMR